MDKLDVRLPEEEIKTLADQVIAALAYNAKPAGVEVMEGRGYTARMVVYSMIRDILEFGDTLGMDSVALAKAALAQHACYCDDHVRVAAAAERL